jgi:hypothetical protein
MVEIAPSAGMEGPVVVVSMVDPVTVGPGATDTGADTWGMLGVTTVVETPAVTEGGETGATGPVDGPVGPGTGPVDVGTDPTDGAGEATDGAEGNGPVTGTGAPDGSRPPVTSPGASSS